MLRRLKASRSGIEIQDVNELAYELGKYYETCIRTNSNKDLALQAYLEGSDSRCVLAAAMLTKNPVMLKRAAVMNNAEAQYQLASLFGSKHTRYLNDSDIEWLERAAYTGHKDAVVALSRFYRNRKKWQKAYDLVAELALSGYAPAEYAAGRSLMIYDWETPTADAVKGKQLIQSAADKGYPNAMYWIGNYWLTSREKPNRAMPWLQKFFSARAKQLYGGISDRKINTMIECYCSLDDRIGYFVWNLHLQKASLSLKNCVIYTDFVIASLIHGDICGDHSLFKDSVYEKAVEWLSNHPEEAERWTPHHSERLKFETTITSALPLPIVEVVLPHFISFVVEGTPSVFGYECGAYPPEPSISEIQHCACCKRASEDTRGAKRQRLQ